MDSIVFEESVNTEISSSEFVDKQWLYVNDNNNGSYSSQVVLDTTPLANSGQYINWSEAFILLPLMLQIESAAIGNVAAATNFDFLGALKSGYWNLLHSLTCEFNNGNIIQQVPFLNVFCSFKNLTSWSQNDLTNWSAVTGFHPDTATSWCYCDIAPLAAGLVVQTGGTGLANNRDSPYVSITSVAVSTFTGTPVAAPLPDPYTPAGTIATSIGNYNQVTQATAASNNVRTSWNAGLFERQMDINYDPTLSAAGVGAFSSNKGALMSAADCRQVFRSFVAKDADNCRYYSIDAVIRLKDVADFFQKCPMLKGSTMRIYLNTNQAYFTLGLQGARYAAGTGLQTEYGAVALTSAPVILGGGGTNPVMFPSVDLGQGGNLLVPLVSNAGAANTAAVAVGLSIVRTQFSQLAQQKSCPITSVRLYAPAYTMNPIAEQRYLSLTPSKKVIYNDIFQFSFPNQAVNSPFNILVTNGIPNIRSVLVVPLLPKASNGTIVGADIIAGCQTSNTLLSPFCSTPASPDPLAITNFQIQVSGRNLFINQLQYDYETFVEQLVCSNQLNGSLTTSLASGLISKRDFQSLYRYYYGNCSRSLPSEEGVSKAIQILGTIQSPIATAVDLMVFVEFEREITIDVRTGARIA